MPGEEIAPMATFTLDVPAQFDPYPPSPPDELFTMAPSGGGGTSPIFFYQALVDFIKVTVEKIHSASMKFRGNIE